MKIREDFVTNSSSSSFIILGKSIDIKDIDLSNNKYICIGKYINEGCDVFELDNDMYEYLYNEIITRKLSSNFYGSEFEDIEFYKYFMKINDEIDISMKDLNKNINMDEKFKIINIDQDYCSSRDISDLKDRYGDED